MNADFLTLNFSRITCSPDQVRELLSLGIEPYSILNIQTGQLLWTKAELDAMIGPRFSKPDLWDEMRLRAEGATDPNTYPVFTPSVCSIFSNGAQASAYGLIFLIKSGMLDPAECNARYQDIFLNKHYGPEDTNNQY